MPELVLRMISENDPGSSTKDEKISPTCSNHSTENQKTKKKMATTLIQVNHLHRAHLPSPFGYTLPSIVKMKLISCYIDGQLRFLVGPNPPFPPPHILFFQT